MMQITKALLITALVSVECFAAVPSNPEELSFEEIASAVDKLQLTREDCKIRSLVDIQNVLLERKVTKKLPSEKVSPYIKKLSKQVENCKKNALGG